MLSSPEIYRFKICFEEKVVDSLKCHMLKFGSWSPNCFSFFEFTADLQRVEPSVLLLSPLLLPPRKEWAALGNMSKQEAMTEFVKLLNRCCHLFSTYVTSHKIEKEEQEKKR